MKVLIIWLLDRWLMASRWPWGGLWDGLRAIYNPRFLGMKWGLKQDQRCILPQYSIHESHHHWQSVHAGFCFQKTAKVVWIGHQKQRTQFGLISSSKLGRVKPLVGTLHMSSRNQKQQPQKQRRHQCSLGTEQGARNHLVMAEKDKLDVKQEETKEWSYTQRLKAAATKKQDLKATSKPTKKVLG